LGRLTLRFGVLILVRHGQTDANARGLLVGRTDWPLNDRGRQQAQAVAATLPAVTRVISSPLLRARETARAFGLAVETDERWIELDYGELDGEPASSVVDEVWRRWHADPEFVPAGGESLAALARRVREACADLVDEARARHIVVVSHVSPIKAAVTWALRVDDVVAWRMWLDDAAICRIRIDGDFPVLTAFNEVVAPMP
jgi:broad specificity phosphatase PhoE